MKLFAENGVQNALTAAIAKEVGSAAGTLFLYFPTKQDLIEELILHVSRENPAFVKSNLSSDLSTRGTFWTIWESYIRWFLAHEDAYCYIRQVKDSGLPVAEAVSQETTRNLEYFFCSDPERPGCRRHQTISRETDRRHPLPGHRRRDEPVQTAGGSGE